MSKLVKFTLHTLNPREAMMEAFSLQASCTDTPMWVWLEYYMRAVRFARFNETESTLNCDLELKKRLLMINDAQYIQSIADDAYAAGDVYDDPAFRSKAFFDAVEAKKGGAQ